MNDIAIAAVGDVFVGGLLSQNVNKYKATFLSEEIFKNLNSADIRFCNLESPLCRLDNPPDPDKTLLYAQEGAIELIRRAGFNIVSLANNHSMDFGWKSLEKTIDLLKEKDIKCIGAGRTLRESRKPAQFKINGIKIAFLAYTWTPPMFKEGSTSATENSPGVSPYNLKYIEEDIAHLKNESDFIIVSAHWGDEYLHYPNPQVIYEAHEVIDMGADIIIGHHPHVLQGYEKYKDGFIFYSLSNFLFSQWFATGNGRWITYENSGMIKRWHSESRKGAILNCNLVKSGGIDYELIPTLQEKKEPIVTLLPKKGQNKIINTMRKWSLEYQKPNYNENYEKLLEKANKFKFLRMVKNEINTYGVLNTLMKGKKKILGVVR